MADGAAWCRRPGMLILGALVGVELILLYAPTARWLFERWTLDVWQHAHGLFMPFVMGYFAYRIVEQHRDLPAAPSALGFAIVLPALAARALDAGMHTQLLSAGSLLLILPGLTLLFAGVQWTRLMLFPFLLGLFALPLPLAFTADIQWTLREITTVASTAIADALGVTLYAEGTTIHLTAGTVSVADACSGFSTLYAALTVAAICIYLTPSTTRRIVLCLAVVPLAIASNCIRVLLLILAVSLSDMSILDTPLHPASGYMTFAIVIPILLWISKEAPLVGAASRPRSL